MTLFEIIAWPCIGYTFINLILSLKQLLDLRQ